MCLFRVGSKNQQNNAKNNAKHLKNNKRSQEIPHSLRHLLLHGLNPLTIFQAMLLKIQDLSIWFDLRLG